MAIDVECAVTSERESSRGAEACNPAAAGITDRVGLHSKPLPTMQDELAKADPIIASDLR